MPISSSGSTVFPASGSPFPVVEGAGARPGEYRRGNGCIGAVFVKRISTSRLVSGNIRQGTLQGFDQGGGVAIEPAWPKALGLSIGDTLRVISPDGGVTPFSVNPRVKAYPIVAIFEIGMSVNSSIVMMPLSRRSFSSIRKARCNRLRNLCR